MLVTQELIHLIHKNINKRDLIAIEVDLEKAYDS